MRFRRKDRTEQDPAPEEANDAADPSEPGSQPSAGLGQGPHDAGDVAIDEDSYVDLGSLVIPVQDEFEVQLQVDEDSGEILAVLVGNERGAIEVRAFAAPRSGDLWADAIREIAADAAQRGGTAEEQDGPFGRELACQVPVELPDGTTGVQPSRVVGHNGKRWFLRATILGEPAMDAATEGPYVELIRSLVVRRGADPMPPGEPLPLTLPPDAEPIASAQEPPA